MITFHRYVFLSCPADMAGVRGISSPGVPIKLFAPSPEPMFSGVKRIFFRLPIVTKKRHLRYLRFQLADVLPDILPRHSTDAKSALIDFEIERPFRRLRSMALNTSLSLRRSAFHAGSTARNLTMLQFLCRGIVPLAPRSVKIHKHWTKTFFNFFCEFPDAASQGVQTDNPSANTRKEIQ